MKKITALILSAVMTLSLLPAISFAEDISVEAQRAFSWNFETNAQNGTLPTAVSWGNRRACFMTFEMPESVRKYKGKNVIAEAILTADMTFNNGRVSGQAPIVTIIEADADAINSVSMTGGSETTSALTAAWETGRVLGTIDTLNEDVSEVLDISEAIASGKESIGLYLTCRSEDGYNKTNGIVNFISPVLRLSVNEINEEFALSKIELPYCIDGGFTLPDEIYGYEIAWSDTTDASDTTLYKTITAKIGDFTKDFDVMIMGSNDNFIAAYTKNDSVAVGKSMHLAIKTEDGWSPLNFDMGVLFAEADLDDGTAAGTTKVLDKPYLYRKDNGKIGVAAKCATLDGAEDSHLTLWETDNLVDFQLVGKGEAEGYENTDRIEVDGIEGEVSSLLPISAEEAEYLLKKLGEVTNTGVEKIEITTPVGTKVTSLPNLIANYSDTSKAEIPVKWNTEELEAIDFTKPGKYTVTGEAAVSEYESPMIHGAADPVVYRYKDKYYFIATNETGGQVDLYIRCAETVEALAQAQPVLIFKHTSSGDHSGCNWAPELHEIGGELYCLFASSTTGSWNAVQSRIMKCTGDPMDIASWESPVRITKKDGSALMQEGITLDMTYFEANGKSYYAWAERPITSAGNGNSYIAIAAVDPSDPYRLASDRVIIRVPGYGWDRRTATVDEGPNVLKHDGRLYMTFSGSGCDNTYCLGLLTADEDADLLNAESWKVTGYPVLASEHVAGEYGPGHNSFTTDEYGRDVIVLHMKPGGGTRSMTARTLHYAFDGTPLLYMTADRYLKEEYRAVTATVYVRDEGMSDDEFKAWTVANNLEIHNADNVKGHITLPTEADGADIAWQSSAPDVITNDGIVTRGDTDKSIKMTASVCVNGITVERKFELTVKAKPQLAEKTGYIYAYFRGGINGEKEVQQIHLAISDDGLNWRDLNGNFPVIESTMGTKGLRDPYLIRSYEGDRFYLMATDLDANASQWTQYGENGSKYLMFWESDDLVNWSEQRMIRVANDEDGCTWAPEAIYDEENNEYMIYWSAHRKDLGDKKVVQYAKTRDFITFSKPVVWIQSADEKTGVIDTSMVKGHDGRYYRYTKREYNNSVFLDVADSPTGEYTRMSASTDSITGVEGPAIFEMNDGKYCLMLDGYAGGAPRWGFFPLISDDISTGQFTLPEQSEYKMPTGAKHGTVIGITAEEYQRVTDKWGPLPADGDGSEPAYSYTFDEGAEDSEYTLHGSAKTEDGRLVLDGTAGTYVSLPDGIFDRRDTYTVSMDVLSNMESGFFFTFAIGENTSDYLYLRIRGNHVRLAQTISGNSYEEQINYVPETDFNEGWHNYTFTGEPDGFTLYIDGVNVGSFETAKTPYHLGSGLPVTLGKSTFSGDLYFDGSFDNIKIYNRAITQEEIMELNSAEKLFNADIDGISFLNPDETAADLILPEKGRLSGCEFTWKSSDTDVIANDGRITRGTADKTVTMTLTAVLGEMTAERTYDFTVLAAEENTAYLFAYFTGNSASQERLFYGVSRDGCNFRALNGGSSVLTSTLGTGCIRDPFIMKGEDGYYYIIATDMKSSLGWSSNYATVVYKTPDLINIVDKAWINYREFSSSAGCTRAWAPQAIWCPEKNAYMIYLSLAIPNSGYGTVMYRQYATDLCDMSTYTEPELMLDEPYENSAAIDGDIIYDKFRNKYIMHYDGKRIAAADTLSGEWTHAETKYSDGQLPMVTSTGAAMAVEGSNIWQIIGEDRWIIAADGTSFNGGCYALVETTDFENYTQLWESSGDYSFDFTPRHGYVIPISERELENLFERYGSVELPEVGQYTFKADLSARGVDIAEDMYGIFFEDINYAADGGIYSEVIKNRSFEAAHCNPDRGEAYTKIPGRGWSTENASAQYLSENPLNKNNQTYVRLTAQAGGSLSNDCYSGFAVHEGECFNASIFARGSYGGKITVSIVENENVLGSVSFSNIGAEFEKHAGVIKTRGTAEAATVKITLDTAGLVDMDMISVQSRDTYNGRENGLRKDIVQMLADLHPGFIRFPGGCVAEGYYLNNRYSWKDSVGPVEERRENWNRWQTGSNAYDYCQTLGLGFYEYFLLCEDIGAKPLPVLSAGIACQYQSGEASSWEDLYGVYIRDALDLIEFANGDPLTNEWAALRAEMGHPEPFNLEYIGIGNEQWNTSGNRFFERYEAFEEEIHKYYPDIKLISTSGPSPDGDKFENAWSWLETHNGEEGFTYAVDEHYYKAPEWFLANINRYDSYDRAGFGVFAGEYAANGAYANTLYAAIAEAAYMTGLEKNADIVRLASYAPLLAKEGYTQWSPNLIWFNNSTVYGSPDYYVQKLYANNSGTYTVKNSVISAGREKVYKAGAGTWSTSAQFKDITVTNDITSETVELVLGEASLGTWTEEEGVYSQTNTSANGAFNVAPVGCKEYTLSLKAMKTGGSEGFLIPVQYVDKDNYIFWNIAGWGNTKSAVQRVDNGTKTTVTSSVPTIVEENVWYDISVKVTEDAMYCYLNGELIQSAFIAKTEGPVYAAASVDEHSGDVIIKLVNSGSVRAEVNIEIENAAYIAPEATAYILTGSKEDKNSAGNPTNAEAREEVITGAGKCFDYTLSPLSFTVLRLHTKENYIVSIDDIRAEPDALPKSVTVNMSDGTVSEARVTWKVPKGAAFAFDGVYVIEGMAEGTDIFAHAVIDKRAYLARLENGKAFFKAKTPAKAYIAIYDADGGLSKVISEGFEGELEIDVSQYSTVKAFIWDENMQPLTDAAETK